MTAHQIAVNSRILREHAAKLEQTGYTGDAYRFVESLVVSVLADGYRPLERPVPDRGAGSTEQARRTAIEQAKAAIDQARRQRTTVARPDDRQTETHTSERHAS